jgi:hypothetical protein
LTWNDYNVICEEHNKKQEKKWEIARYLAFTMITTNPWIESKLKEPQDLFLLSWEKHDRLEITLEMHNKIIKKYAKELRLN